MNFALIILWLLSVKIVAVSVTITQLVEYHTFNVGVKGPSPFGHTINVLSKMTKNTGYRQVLRDRCPKVVNFALKWCKAKEKWLDYVYDNFIWIYSSKKERYAATKTIVGDKRNFNFHNTIDWNALMPDEKAYWEYVDSWVKFFTKEYAYIESAYANSCASGDDIATCKFDIMKRFLIDLCPKTTDSKEIIESKNKYVNDLTDFLIDCFEGRIQ